MKTVKSGTAIIAEPKRTAQKGKPMDDLISRQDAIDAIKEYIVDPNRAISECEDNVFNYNAGLKSAVQAIVDLPHAQPEIIRCNECKYAHITYGGEVKYCDIWFPDESHYMDTDNYCSFAEMREE